MEKKTIEYNFLIDLFYLKKIDYFFNEQSLNSSKPITLNIARKETFEKTLYFRLKYFIYIFILSGFSFTNIHNSQDGRERDTLSF